MIVKSQDWADFKKAIINFALTLEKEGEKLVYDDENDFDFSLWVEDCRVYPVFTKKPDFLKVEYDFTNCDIEIRTLSFSKFKDAGRMEMTLKRKKDDHA